MKNGPHFPHRQHYGKALALSGADHSFQVPYITTQHRPVEKRKWPLLALTWTENLYSGMTIETTYTAARDQLKALMDRVVEDREVVMVRRRQGGDVALVAADELEGLLETAHLLRSPRNAARLLAALERAQSETLPARPLEALEAWLEP